MTKGLRTLVVGVSALIGLGGMAACSSGSPTEPTPQATSSPGAATSAAPAVAQSGNYVTRADQDGQPMSIGIAVQGDRIAGYACNGVDEEAWFFGEQHDGDIDITSKSEDTLQAEFDGDAFVGDLTMDGRTFNFTAPGVPAPGGLYLAELDGTRATWVVQPDGSSIGNQSGGGSDTGDTGERARNRRVEIVRASALTRQPDGTMRATINGQSVVAEPLGGDFRF
ncbi:hypothetical protein [Mycolicibacterium palauense]|uniref:hypothetical protein n=1 Tax=Mycolicibacterium palauense TaxID=2034511 RepID=UPI000BFEC948|nr:hypothetical protein [Mycolicibacterium palauense]